MYEPLREGWSRARVAFDILSPSSRVLQNIAYLAEQAKSEARPRDYLTPRAPYQLVYGLLQEGRFDPEMIQWLESAQTTLMAAHDGEPVPVRVYADRQKDGIPDAAILNSRLQHKIYAQNEDAYKAAAKEAAPVSGSEHRAQVIVKQLLQEAANFNISGVELNLLNLTRIFGEDEDMLPSLIRRLLATGTPEVPELAFVQSVSIQPNRIDFPGKNISLNEMNRAINAVADTGFKGTIIYAPGGGDPAAEVKDLRSRFGLD